MKELAYKFEGQFKCLGENVEKYKTFSASVEKELAKIDEDGNESVLTISYKVKFIDTGRFMASLLSNLVDNLVEEVQKIKCKICDCFIECENVKDNSIKYKCLSCNKDY